MAPEQEKRFDEFQKRALGIAFACLVAKWILDTDGVGKELGAVWVNIKQANIVIMWLSAILSGQKLVDFIVRIKQVTELRKVSKDLDKEEKDE